MLTAEQVQKMIDDALGKATTAIVTELKTPKTDNGATAAATARATPHAAKSRYGSAEDRIKRQRETDPHKGAGFHMAMIALCEAKAFIDRTTVFEAAKEIGYGEDFLGKLEEARDVQKTMQASVFASGGSLVLPQQVLELIPLLQTQGKFFEWGPTDYQLVADAVDMPRVTSGTTAEWVGEQQSAGPVDMGTGTQGLALKDLNAVTIISQRLITGAILNPEQLVRDQLVRDYGIKLSITGWRSVGGQKTPKGIRYLMAAANIFNQAGITADNIESDLYKLIGKVTDGNVPGPFKFGFSDRVRRGLMQVQRNGIYLFKQDLQGDAPKLLGYPCIVGTELPTNLGGGTETEIYFGAGSEIQHAHGVEMQMRATSEAAVKDGANVRSMWSERAVAIDIFGRHDFGMKHDVSMACIPNSTIGA